MESTIKLEIVLKSGYRFIANLPETDISGDITSELADKLVANSENDILYIDSKEIALVRTMGKIQNLETTRQESGVPAKYGETMPLGENCPICHQQDKSYIYFDNLKDEYFAYCDRCDIKTEENYKSKESAKSAFISGKITPANF